MRRLLFSDHSQRYREMKQREEYKTVRQSQIGQRGSSANGRKGLRLGIQVKVFRNGLFSQREPLSLAEISPKKNRPIIYHLPLSLNWEKHTKKGG